MEKIRTAEKLERQGNLADALRAYEAGLSQLLSVLKTESSQKRREELTRIIETNMSKAERLKKRNVVTPSKENDSFVKQMLGEAKMNRETRWEDVAGLEEAKKTLQEAVVLPHLRPDLYRGLRSPARGVLLYGPPGTGKTMLARAVASEGGLTFFAPSVSSMTSKWVGEGEKMVKALFEAAESRSPAAIFVDEIDSLLSRRGEGAEHEASRRFKTEFLVRIDGMHSTDKKIFLLGASNRPWDLDDAVLRRLPRRILIPLPDPLARRSMLDKLLDGRDGVPHSLTSKDKDVVVSLTDHFSMSDLRSLAEEAALEPLRALGDKIRNVKSKDVRKVNLKDFTSGALDRIKPSADAALLQKYEQWTRDFGTRGS